jgi:ribosomal-protein-alanine N-acetyltransferase
LENDKWKMGLAAVCPCRLPLMLQSADMDWGTLPTIDTRRLFLRSISGADVDSFFEIYSNPEVMRYWSTPPLPNRDAAAEQVVEIQKMFERREMLKWGIALRTDNRLIGSVTLFHPDFTHHRVELGYALGRDYWGQGYMKETLSAVLPFAFGVLDMHRIEADVDPRNDASIKALERMGFQREGYLRERWQVNGEIQDAYFYGLLKPDWERLRARPSRPELQSS